MVKETRKILDCPGMQVSATCVRIPVFNAHSECITVQCRRKPGLEKVRELLGSFPGNSLMDEPSGSIYPTPLEISGKDDVFIGRVRENPALENAIDMWVVSDNIRKGAALNAVQIAEILAR